jgi:hypothetical protein
VEDEDLINFGKARHTDLHSLKLPAFWVDKPVSWFVLAESRFRLHGINRVQTRYDYLVLALTKEVISLVLEWWSILQSGSLIQLSSKASWIRNS